MSTRISIAAVVIVCSIAVPSAFATPTPAQPAPLLADLIAAPTCVAANQPTSFAWQFRNNDAKQHAYKVWFYGIGITEGKGPAYDVNVTKSDLVQTTSSMASWSFTLKPGQSLIKTIYLNSVWPDPNAYWDPSWGVQPQFIHRFWFGGNAYQRFSPFDKNLVADPPYCK